MNCRIFHDHLKPRPNDRNMPTQHIATLLGATWCVRLATVLRCVATCWVLLAQVWNSCDMLCWHVAIVWPGLNASALIIFWKVQVKANLFFPNFLSLFPPFQGQKRLKKCLRFAIFNCSKKLQYIFEIGLKNVKWSYKNRSRGSNISK